MSRYGLGYLQLNRKEQDFYSRMEELLHKHETKFIIPSGIDVIKVLDVRRYEQAAFPANRL